MHATDLADLTQRRQLFHDAVTVAATLETHRAYRDHHHLVARAVEVLIVVGVTNARTEAANTSIKNIKRTGRADTATPPTTRPRILLASAARTAA